MTLNPFVRLYEYPVETLTALAYALVLLATTVWLAGVWYRVGLSLYNEVQYRHDAGNYDPAWQYVPPYRVIGLAGLAVFLLAVEAALIGGIIYVIG